jgi:hypothetical protein
VIDMRALIFPLLLAACGGKTETSTPADAAPSDSSSDAANDAAPVCFSMGALISVPFKACNDDGDCVALLHQDDCCGNQTWIGVAKSEEATVRACETASRSTFPACGCPASSPKTEDGMSVDFDGRPSVHCVDRTSSSGICKTTFP